MRLFLSLFLIWVNLSVENNTYPEATTLIQSSEQYLRSEQYYANMKITTVRPKYTREMTIKTWTKGMDKGVILITSPAKEKGIAFLKIEDQIWNWMPSLNKVIKMPPALMGQSWMGTDFTNNDLIQNRSAVEDYTCKVIGKEIINEIPCYRIEMLPMEDAMVVWGKLDMWISENGTMVMKQVFYDEDMDVVNTMTGSEVKTLGNKTIPTKLEMIPSGKDGHKTIMEYLDLDLNQELQDEFFTIQNVKRLKG